MRSKNGVFALINYSLYAIFGIIGVAIFVSNSDALQVPGFNILFLALGFGAITLAAYGIFLLVFKLLHMGTRFALFGIPCLLGDTYVIWHLVPRIISMDAITDDMIIMILWLLLSVGSLISNIMSMKG